MKLNRICKANTSVAQGQCPAIYTTDRPGVMVGQGKVLDDHTTAELLDMAPDETAVAIPTETVLRAAGKFMAAQGHESIGTEIEAFLASDQGKPHA